MSDRMLECAARSATLLAFVLLACLAGPAGAQEEESMDWWTRNFEMHGFVTSKAYFRTPNFDLGKEVQMSSWRNEANLETELRMFERENSRLRLFGVFRPVYEGIYDLYPDTWGKRSRNGQFGTNTAGVLRRASDAKTGRSFPGHGAGVEGEFFLVNNDVGQLFTGHYSPAIVIDDIVFYGSVPAPWRPVSGGQSKIGGHASAATFNFASTNPLLPGSAALAASLGMASQPLGTPLRSPSGYRPRGDRSSLRWLPGDVNEHESALQTECTDNAHPWCWARELYAEFETGSTTIRVGRQQIVWGKTDAFRLQDIVNPIDIGYHNVFPDLEERRIPSLSLDVIHGLGKVGPLEDVSAEFVWVFDRFRPVQLGQCGEPYAFTTACELRADASGHGLLNISLAGVEERDWQLENTEPGVRFEFRIPEPSISFSLSAFWGFQDAPAVKFKNLYSTSNPNPAALLFLQAAGVPIAPFDPYTMGTPGDAPGTPTVFGASNTVLATWNALVGFCGGAGAALVDCINGNNAFGPGGTPLNFQAFSLPWSASEAVVYYPRVLTVGGSGDYQIPGIDTVLRTEVAFDFDRHITDTSERDGVSKSNVVMAAIGLDRSTFIPFLNQNRTAFLSFQTFMEHILSYEEGAAGMVPWRTTWISTAFMQNYWRNDSIVLTSFVAFDWRGNSWITGPSLKWIINERWFVEGGVNVLWGERQKHNIRDLCATGDLACLADPTTWQDGNWQSVSARFLREAESPYWNLESFADHHSEERDEFWFGVTYQF
jgi:hypothetical protein